jgi:diguanylate cyclase (GGDEF)-like protein/PAS domain S-box-containing protein
MCADLAKVTSLETPDLPENPINSGSWHLDPSAFVTRYSGPAIMIERSAAGQLRIIAANALAQMVTQAVEENALSVRSLVDRTLDFATPTFQKTAIESAGGKRHFELYGIPLSPTPKKPSEASVLLFGQETTLDNNLTQALMDSRQMFKDMLGCSRDFAWETDASGVFRYVSPKGAFGYAPHELAGRKASDILAPHDNTRDDNTENPFTPREPLVHHDAQITAADGNPMHIKINAVPVRSRQGEWLGARGLCRDEDQLESLRAKQACMDLRLDMNLRLTSMLRDITAPRQLLQSMARTTAEVTGQACLVFRRRNQGFACHGTSKSDIHSTVLTAIGEELLRLADNHLTGARRSYSFSTEPPFSAEAMTFDILPTMRQGNVTGALVVQTVQEGPMDDDLLTLMHDAADHLGIALDLTENRESVRQLTLNDDLTGLLNMKAFEEQVIMRMSHQRRTDLPATLLLLDIDDFETINDRFGFSYGDSVLERTAGLLSNRSRVGDVLCRVGRERFALWLEGAEERGAGQKAKLLVNLTRELKVGSEDEDFELSVCIGGAVSLPNGSATLRQLTEQAIIALGQAKQKGRGQWMITPAAENSAEEENRNV